MKYVLYGARGVEMLPHHTFWINLADRIKVTNY